MQQQDKELDNCAATLRQGNDEDTDEDDEELNFEADIRQAYEEIIDNISTIRDTLKFFRQSKRSSLQICELERLQNLQKERSNSLDSQARLPVSTLRLRYHERKGRSWTYNDALIYKAVRQKLQSRDTKENNDKMADKREDDCVVTKDDNVNDSSAEQFTSKCELNNKDAITIPQPKSSKKHSTDFSYLRRAFALLKLSEKDNTNEKNNADRNMSSAYLESRCKKVGLTIRTLKTKNDILHVVKADI